MNTPLPMCLLPLAAVLIAAPAVAEQAPRVAAEPYRAELHAKYEPAERWSGVAASIVQPDAELRLLALPAERIDAVKRGNERAEFKRLRIGIERDLGSEIDTWDPAALTWKQVPGGWQASLDVVVPGAAAVRVAVPVAGLPDGAWLRYAGTGAATQLDGADVERMRDQVDAQGRFWTATTSGETQRLEWFVPDAAAATLVAPRIAGVSHLIVDPYEPDFQLKALGASGSCNIDVVCRTGTLGNLFVQAKNAVAHMVFQDGGTYVCTGTLLNDTDTNTQRKWFYGAHHCIGTQGVANTLETYWNYETPTCNVDNSGPNIRVTGGADLRYTQASSDALLLELRGTLPSGVGFAGWDASVLGANTQVTAIHHPSGDIKKVSFGRYLRTQAGVVIGGQSITSSWRATWDQGTTEGGSSGSGLFTRDASSYYLRGGLIGGAASCSNSGGSEAAGNYDFYSRFDQVFPSIQQYIASGGSSNGATRDYTGQWHNANEGGRGLSLFRLNAGGLFGLWFVYDSQGRASWYQLEDIWTGTDVLSGRVVRWTGPAWGPNYNPANRSFVQTGTYTLTFTSATTANFSYNVDGVNRTISLVRATP